MTVEVFIEEDYFMSVLPFLSSLNRKNYDV